MTGNAAHRPLVSLVIPTYNEVAILETNLGRLCDYMDSLAEYRWEMVLVDDGSSDDTAARARAFATNRENVVVLEHPINFRLGQALRYGFSHCRGEYVVTYDIDLSYAPEHIGRLLERITTSGAKLVVASPYMKGGRTSHVPWHRLLLSRWGNRFLARTARGIGPGGGVATLTGLVRAYDARFLKSLHLRSMGMEINTEVIHKALILNARIEEIPAHLDWSDQRTKSRVRSSSKRIGRGIRFGLFAGFFIRPFAFFILPSSLLALVALYISGWIGYHVQRNYVASADSVQGFDARISAAIAQAFSESPHAFVVGGIMLVLAVQLFSLGVVSLQVKEYFEELFHLGTTLSRKLNDLDPNSRGPARRGESEPGGRAPSN